MIISRLYFSTAWWNSRSQQVFFFPSQTPLCLRSITPLCSSSHNFPDPCISERHPSFWSHHGQFKSILPSLMARSPGLAIFCLTQQALCLPCSLYIAASAISWVLLCWPNVPGAHLELKQIHTAVPMTPPWLQWGLTLASLGESTMGLTRGAAVGWL